MRNVVEYASNAAADVSRQTPDKNRVPADLLLGTLATAMNGGCAENGVHGREVLSRRTFLVNPSSSRGGLVDHRVSKEVLLVRHSTFPEKRSYTV